MAPCCAGCFAVKETSLIVTPVVVESTPPAVRDCQNKIINHEHLHPVVELTLAGSMNFALGPMTSPFSRGTEGRILLLCIHKSD